MEEELKDEGGQEGTRRPIGKAYPSTLLALSPITFLSPEFTTWTRKIFL